MFFKTAIFSFLAASSIVVNAAPELEHRQIGSVFNSITSAAASAVTGGGASIVSEITSAGGNVVSDVTSVAGGVYATVTSVGGQAATVVTSVGGQAITLAGTAGGVVTSFGGSLYTVATGVAGSAASQAAHTNSAVGAPSFGLSSSHAIGLITVVCSALVGALITL